MADMEKFWGNFNSPGVIESNDIKESKIYDEHYDSDDDSFLISSTLLYDNKESDSLDRSLDSNVNSEPIASTPERVYRQSTQKIYKKNRPPDLIISDASDDDNNNMNLKVTQYSPIRSPFPELNDTLDFNNSFTDLDETLEPPHYNTPPTGIEFNKRDRKMACLLQRHGLGHFIFIFFEQEVDFDLFLTLNNRDLEEIGIIKKADRQLLLSIIEEYNKRY